MKKYIIFAGVNGAGKSTLYQTNPGLFDMPRINMDEIVQEFGTWRNAQDVMTAEKIAVKSLKNYIELYYVGVDSVKIAKERVRQRVLAGGHGIPEQDIEKRIIQICL